MPPSRYTLSKKDGTLLLLLPPPLRGMTPTPEIQGAFHTTLGGRRVLHKISVKRTWNLSWNRLPNSTYQALTAYHLGTNGSGPFLYCAPDTDGVGTLVNIGGLDPTVELEGFWDVRLTLLEV